MLELIKKKDLTKEELELLDHYFFNDHIEELLLIDNKDIISFIESVEKEFGISLTKNELEYSLKNICFDAKVFFDEEDLFYDNKILELINYFDFYDCGLSYVIGDYYYYDNDKNTALKYYQMDFKPGFNLCDEGYFDSLNRYIELIDNKKDVLISLINASSIDEYNEEFVYTYLLLVNYLDKNSNEYLSVINKVIDIATVLVREYQKDNDDFISDSDIERSLCELLSLKMEYYVNKNEYVKAFELYNKLTEEIKESGCMRYYHARDLFYYKMIKLMSKDYPKLKFFDNISNKIFKVISDDEKLLVNQEIILEDESKNKFNFIVTNIHNNSEIVIAPILPLIGVGGLIFTTLIVKNNQMYLKNNF